MMTFYLLSRMRGAVLRTASAFSQYCTASGNTTSCNTALATLKVRSHDATLLHETRAVSPWSTAPRCFKALQVFPTMSDCKSWENTASCPQDVVEGGYGSNAPWSKVASSGLASKHSTKRTVKRTRPVIV